MAVDFGQEHLLDQLDTLVAIHLYEFMLFAIIVEYFGNLISEASQPPAHGFPFIISTLIEPTAIQITNPGSARWPEGEVVHMLIRLTEQSTSKPTQYLFARHLEIDSQVYF